MLRLKLQRKFVGDEDDVLKFFWFRIIIGE